MSLHPSETHVAYGRSATDPAAARMQISDAVAAAAVHGVAINRFYCEGARSGVAPTGPALRALLYDAARGAVDVVIVESVSRLSRDTETLPLVIRRLDAAGVRIFEMQTGRFVTPHNVMPSAAPSWLRPL